MKLEITIPGTSPQKGHLFSVEHTQTGTKAFFLRGSRQASLPMRVAFSLFRSILNEEIVTNMASSPPGQTVELRLVSEGRVDTVCAKGKILHGRFVEDRS